jgi:hypothetical protein
MTGSMDNFCNRCRKQFRSATGFEQHLARNINHKAAPPTTDREINAMQERYVFTAPAH